MTSLKELSGRTLGRYTLAEHLATGGMAEIFLASHEAPNGFSKELVLKIMQSRYAENQEVVEMFLAEARLGAKLNHPNIVDIYDVGEDQGLHYIVMEFIQGQTLTDLVRRTIEVSKPLPTEVAAYIVAETAAGLAYMHDGSDGKGRRFAIIHRDISPSNLVISLSGQTKIIDFGIAREAEGDEDLEGARPGKVSYMSPEQVRGEPLDGRSDIFSLGTILYEITLGKRLWRGPKEQVVRRIVEEKPPPPTYVRRDYPPNLELIVLRALEKRPEDRYPTAGDLFQDIEDYLARSGARTRNHHVAQFLHELYAPDAEVSEMGVRRARAFADDDQFGDDDELDFDRRSSGAGRSFAEALRSSGPIVSSARLEASLSALASDADAAPAATPASTKERAPERSAPALALAASASAPKSSRRWGLVIGVLIVAAAAAGILWGLAHV